MKLQSKLKQAEVWVERVRSAVPRGKKTTRNKADMEKVEFGTMKTLLNEVSESICCRRLEHEDVAGCDEAK